MEKQLTAEQKNQSMIGYILEIDSLTTYEFCNRYNIPKPTPKPGGVESLVNDLLQVDAIKHKMFVEKAKELYHKQTEPATEKEPVKDGFEKYLENKIAFSSYTNVISICSDILDNYRKFSPVSQTKGLDITDEEISQAIESSSWMDNEDQNTFEDKYNFLEINKRILISKLSSLLSQSKQETETNQNNIKMNGSDNMREANFNAWKDKHDREVKKCNCEAPNPRPTNKNECWDCSGEIYKDYLNKVRHLQN